MPFRLEYVFEDEMEPYSKWKEIDISEQYLIDQFEITADEETAAATAEAAAAATGKKKI